ncbi:MAG TPA: ribose-phosphate diphosphokinase [Candidatus Saccharimonadales bacterium]|nr:ribose-phosphate diphosphokinase [Candidatus Saccharimonadales bacterium]
MSRELLIFDGTAHSELTDGIVRKLESDLIDTKDHSLRVHAEVGSFPDGETSIKIKDNVREQDVFVIQPTGPPVNDNIMKSLVIADALRRASAWRVTLVAPYFGYARQDRKDMSRVPITAKLVTDLYSASGYNRLLAVDLHAHQIQGFTNLPFDHLYAGRTIADHLRQELEDPIAVAPDVGAVKMAKGYARRLGRENDWAIVDKDRIDGHTTRVTEIVGRSVVGRNAVIFDDMTSTGGSLIGAAKALKHAGALTVVAAVTHGVLSEGAIERIEENEDLDCLVITDSLPEAGKSHKIRRITIAPLLAQAIQNIHNGQSVSELIS